MRNQIKILLREGLLNEANPMGIANKFGIPEDVTNEVISRYGKKYAVIGLKLFVLNNVPEEGGGDLIVDSDIPLGQAFNPNRLQSYKSELDRVATLEEPVTPIEVLKDLFNSNMDGIMGLIKTTNKPPIDLKSSTIHDLIQFIHKYQHIRDWAENPNVEAPNLRTMTWGEAEQASTEWHDSLKAGDEVTNEVGEIIHKFDDGYYWFNNGAGHCDAEAEAMGHCGTPSRGGMHMISLRKNKKPVVTLDWDPDKKEIIQLKGKQNNKPDSKYHPYIMWFISDPDRVKILNTRIGHKPETNFQLDDMGDEEQEKILRSNGALLIRIEYKKVPENLKRTFLLHAMKHEKGLQYFVDDWEDVVPVDIRDKYIRQIFKDEGKDLRYFVKDWGKVPDDIRGIYYVRNYKEHGWFGDTARRSGDYGVIPDEYLEKHVDKVVSSGHGWIDGEEYLNLSDIYKKKYLGHTLKTRMPINYVMFLDLPDEAKKSYVETRIEDWGENSSGDDEMMLAYYYQHLNQNSKVA